MLLAMLRQPFGRQLRPPKQTAAIDGRNRKKRNKKIFFTFFLLRLFRLWQSIKAKFVNDCRNRKSRYKKSKIIILIRLLWRTLVYCRAPLLRRRSKTATTASHQRSAAVDKLNCGTPLLRRLSIAEPWAQQRRSAAIRALLYCPRKKSKFLSESSLSRQKP